MSRFLNAAATALALTVIGGTASAAPYASLIRVSSTTFTGSMTITYRLNEPADSVSVQIINNLDVPVATFSAPTLRGPNQVVWDGTSDNAGGSPVPSGTFRVRITANKNAATWSEISSNESTPSYGPKASQYATLFDGYSPQDHVFINDTNSDNFGVGLSISSWSFPSHWAAIRTYSDLNTIVGNSFDDRVLRAPQLEAQPIIDDGTADSYDLWGAYIDGDRVYVAGQDFNAGGYRLWLGSLTTSGTMADADPLGGYTSFPREVVVATEGADKYAYITQLGTITKTPINPTTGELSGPAVTITAFSGSHYAKGLALDAEGNLYYTSAGFTNQDRTSGTLLRWNANQIAGANPAEPLSETNAAWHVYNSVNAFNMNDVTITPAGQVYVILVQGSERGLYSVGQVSNAVVTKDLSLGDRVVNLDDIGGINNISAGLASDPAGNLAVFDRNLEQIRLYGPAGNNSKAIVAPTSQSFTVQGSSVNAWSLY